MRMHVLPAGRLRMKRTVFDATADRDARFELPVGAFLLRHPQGNVLFDSGCHPSVATDAAARWGGLAKVMVPVFSEAEALPASLASAGLGADDIDVVVCSHLHSDHCGCNELFRRATVVCNTHELAAARAPDAAAMGYVAADWDHPMPVQAFDATLDLFGDGRIVLLHMPGHTPGMSCARVELDRTGAVLLASDAVSLRDSLDRDYAPRNTWNIEKLLASMAEIRRMEAAGAWVICGHDDAQWRTLRTGAEYYD